jgi:hypothetical protein
MPTSLDSKKPYTSAENPNLINYPDEILDYFGYTFARQKYTLPRSDKPLGNIQERALIGISETA